MYVPARLPKLNLKVKGKKHVFFLDVCDSLHLSPGTVIYEITNKWAPPLEGRICAFFAWGRGNLAGLLSSQWIKVLLPLQRLITTTENEWGREREGGRAR